MLPKFELSLPEQTEFLRKRAFFILKILIDLFLHLKIPQIFGEDKNGQKNGYIPSMGETGKIFCDRTRKIPIITFGKYIRTIKYGQLPLKNIYKHLNTDNLCICISL